MAGEGAFVVTRKPTPFADGTPRLRFVFQVTMATRDRPLLEALRNFLGRGSIHDRPRRQENWQPASTFSIGSLLGHERASIPFAEQSLPDCAKRQQFDLWTAALRSWVRMHPPKYGRGRSICSVPGCNKPVRGQGICRSHYFQRTGY